MFKMVFGYAIPHAITIQATCNRGFTVDVGCQKLVFADKESLKMAFVAYLDDPAGMEGELFKSCASPSPSCPEVPPHGETQEYCTRGYNADRGRPQTER